MGVRAPTIIENFIIIPVGREHLASVLVARIIRQIYSNVIFTQISLNLWVIVLQANIIRTKN